jgi:hypothetical protein
MIADPALRSVGLTTANICSTLKFPYTSAAYPFVFSTLWTLAHFFHERSFVFNTLQTLLPKIPGVGVSPQ